MHSSDFKGFLYLQYVVVLPKHHSLQVMEGDTLARQLRCFLSSLLWNPAARFLHSYGPTPEQRHEFCFALV